MTKQQIAQQLHQWIESGNMTTKRNTGEVYAAIDRKIAKEEYFLTKVKSILATDKETQEAFNAMCERKEVLSFLGVQLEYPQYKTQYSVNKAAANGQFLRFDGFKNIPLYITGE